MSKNDGVSLEPGSLRDPTSRVFVGDRRVVRALTGRSVTDYRALASSRFYADAVAGGRVVASEEVGPSDVPSGYELAIAHPKVPFISYPYEWSFDMLKDAALLTLELFEQALAGGLTMKDATPYNVQFVNGAPIFIDVGSFQPLEPGDPWWGYRQFCELFLYPLMLESYKGIPFQAWLRGAPSGIPPGQFRALLSTRDMRRAGVVKHVALHARMERAEGGRTPARQARSDLKQAGFGKELILANVRGLTKLVRSLESTARSEWAAYREFQHAAADLREKEELVKAVVGEVGPRVVYDLGANDARFAELCSSRADVAVALDADPVVVNDAYRRLRGRSARVLPLVVDVTDPSPARGWRLRERADLHARGAPDLVLCLALVHHLAIGESIPLSEIAVWLREFDADVVAEFPGRSDPQVESLLARKAEGLYDDYDVDTFERVVKPLFDVRRTVALSDGARTLYHLRPGGR